MIMKTENNNTAMSVTEEPRVFDVVTNVCRNYDHHVSDMAARALERFTHDQYSHLKNMTIDEFCYAYGRDAEDIVCDELFDCIGEATLAQYLLPTDDTDDNNLPEFFYTAQDGINLAYMVSINQTLLSMAHEAMEDGNDKLACSLEAEADEMLQEYLGYAQLIVDATSKGCGRAGKVFDYNPEQLTEAMEFEHFEHTAHDKLGDFYKANDVNALGESLFVGLEKMKVAMAGAVNDPEVWRVTTRPSCYNPQKPTPNKIDRAYVKFATEENAKELLAEVYKRFMSAQ
jgi:hypothetical protein